MKRKENSSAVTDWSGFDFFGGMIEKIQTGLLIIPITELSQSVSIEEVDLSKAILTFEFTGSGSNHPQWWVPGGYFVNSNTIEFAKGSVTSSGNNVVIRWRVIEFKNVKSLQRGERLAPYSGYADDIIVINEVDRLKSFAVISAKYASGNNGGNNGRFLTEFINGLPQLRITGPFAVNTTIYWQVIEFE